MSVVVVAILITLLNGLSVTVLVVISHIVLISLDAATEVALCELINIQPIVTTEQILNSAVILSAVYTSTQACSKF